MPDPPCPFVSRGGLKLAAALDAFGVDPAGLVCADLGCNVGGFTDCLLQRGAKYVYAVDTGYGTLAWKLRNDPRVMTLERSNALHFDPDQWGVTRSIGVFYGCNLATIDLAWTRQAHALPAAVRWLGNYGYRERWEPGLPDSSWSEAEWALDKMRWPAPVGKPRIITLIKPHYEADRSLLKGGVLSREDAERVKTKVIESLPSLGVRVLGCVKSPILGGAGKGKAGNVEYLALLEPA